MKSAPMLPRNPSHWICTRAGRMAKICGRHRVVWPLRSISTSMPSLRMRSAVFRAGSSAQSQKWSNAASMRLPQRRRLGRSNRIGERLDARAVVPLPYLDQQGCDRMRAKIGRHVADAQPRARRRFPTRRVAAAGSAVTCDCSPFARNPKLRLRRHRHGERRERIGEGIGRFAPIDFAQDRFVQRGESRPHAKVLPAVRQHRRRIQIAGIHRYDA